MKKDNLKSQYRVNEQIRAREVRIVGDDIESTVLPTRDALRIAEQKGVDLVEISPNAEPPVCRLIDYSKFLYQQKKRQKEMKAKQVKIEVKEIRFGPQTDDHDYNFKLKHAQGFLSDGDKVKAYVFFRGRSILFKEQGEVLLLRFAQDLEEYGKVESMPVLEGKRMTMFIAPKKTAPKKAAPAAQQPASVGSVPVGSSPVSDDFEDEERSELGDSIAENNEPDRKKPQQKARKEYTGPKVEGEDWDD
ncbi:MAG: translation initiation factor IF-3 [Bacteroidaceae bacterium]|nr:translation initiation factor IF-3 [Bacteroidaceae bacterium]MBR1755576.1 translation initiation factor IF-3 [Bacteroidaceae bacterium]